MRESEKKDVYNAAIEVLVADAVERRQPDAPTQYAATVRCDLGKRHYERARELFDAHGDLSVDELVTLLAPPSATKQDEPPNPSSALPAVTAEPWSPLDPETRQQAKAGLAEARAARDRAVAAKQESKADEGELT